MYKSLMIVVMSLSVAVMADDTTVYSDYQCWAQGNHFRVGGSPRSDYLVDSRFAFAVTVDKTKKDQAGEAKLEYIGHVAFGKFVDGKKVLELVDGYAHLHGKDVLSRLSPRARVYKDSEYFRFRSINGRNSTSHDGGGLHGYLVISKNLLNVKSAEESFDAHYVFQHGDHTGGTLDYTCKKE